MKVAQERQGTVYLIHFDQPYKHARHYLGFVDGGEKQVQNRMRRHRKGRGSRLIAVITKAGITWRMVRTWPGYTRSQERKLKNQGGAARLCPICRGKVVVDGRQG
jgi:hypothetical protein